jgi:hypothetical protein
MSPGITVQCDQPTIRSAVQQYLDEGRLHPPVPLTLEIEVGEVPPVPLDSAPPFHQPQLVFYPGTRPGSLTIVWETAPAQARLENGSGRARVILSPAAADRLPECQTGFLMMTVVFLLRRFGWHHVHGATAVDRRGRGWLMAGNSQVGKSTTTAFLASRGWPVGTDDIAFLVPSAGRVAVHAFRSRIGLRPGGLELLAVSGGVFQPRRGKTVFWPEELGGTWVERIEPEVLLFPVIGGDRTTVTPLAPRDTLAQLVRWSAWVILEPQLAQEHLDLLAALGRQAPGYRLELGRDLFSNPQLIDELIP